MVLARNDDDDDDDNTMRSINYSVVTSDGSPCLELYFNA